MSIALFIPLSSKISQLFLRHFRDRQTRKRRIRIKLGLRAAKSGHSLSLPPSLISRDVNEEDALKNWESKEDDRYVENVMKADKL